VAAIIAVVFDNFVHLLDLKKAEIQQEIKIIKNIQ